MVGVRRFCYENVWSYAAPLKCDADQLPTTPCFEWDDPQRYLVGDVLSHEDAVREERQAFIDGLRALQQMLESHGYTVRAGR